MFRRAKSAAVFFGLILTASAGAQTVWFVDDDAGGANDGSSWSDAYTDFQAALGAAASSDQIWVAAGVYKPGSAGSLNTSTFSIPSGVEVYGGLAGSEDPNTFDLTTRDFSANESVLSGDLNNDDPPNLADVLDCRIEPFGGPLPPECSPFDTGSFSGTIVEDELNMDDNSRHVVTLLNAASTTRIDGFTITAGSAEAGSGSNRFGGGLLNDDGSPTVANCKFTVNFGQSGGGLKNDGTSQLVVDGCTFVENVGQDGGGMHTNSFGNPTVVANSLFLRNAARNGGGLYLRPGVTVTNCAFSENRALEVGGATGSGGGLLNIAVQSSGFTVTNSSFGNNSADEGGGVYNASGISFGFNFQSYNNCVFWGNTATTSGANVLNSSSIATFRSSDVEGSGGSGSWVSSIGSDGGGNLDADPDFVDDELHISCASPALDAGDNSLVSATKDRDGNVRIQNVTVDMGAYEGGVGSADPVITCPADVVVECGGSTDPSAAGEPTAIDGCSGAPVAASNITRSDSEVAGCGQEKVITRTWTADTGSGNPASCDQTITVEDSTAPALSLPADATVECDGDHSPTATGSATATDGCDSAPSIGYVESAAAGGCPQESVITRTWTATDACGNSSSADQVISVIDSTGPVVTAPADASVECDADSSSASTGVATAADNCDPAPSVTESDSVTSGGCAEESTITRTWSATDGCSNDGQAVQIVSVTDSTAPSIACPADAVGLECPADTSVAARGSATASDNCGSVSLSSADASVAGCGGTATITRTWSADDDCGNTATCQQTLATVDTTAPTLTVDTTPLSAIDADCSGDESVTLPTASASDDCAGSVAVTNDAPASFPSGETTTVTFTAADGCGNSDTASLDVDVDYGATIKVRARKFQVSVGHHPVVSHGNLAGEEVAAFDKSPGSCARDILDSHFWIHRLALPIVFDECTPVNTAVTDSNGFADIDVPPGDFLVASQLDTDDDNDPDTYVGRYAQNVDCGETVFERLLVIVISTGKKHPCKWHHFTGSDLLVIEPEEIVWDEPVQEYPFVFDSEGDWNVTTSVTPPEGFEPDVPSLSAEVDTEVEAVQFTVTEVGSDLVPTKTAFDITHKGRRIRYESEIGIKLTPDYARSRGFDVDALRARGLIVDKTDVKPRSGRDNGGRTQRDR